MTEPWIIDGESGLLLPGGETRAFPDWAPEDDRWYAHPLYVYDVMPSTVYIDETTALTVAAVYAAVKILADNVAQLPLHLYQDMGGGRRRASERPEARLVRRASNPEMTGRRLIQTGMRHLTLWGNFYIYVLRDPVGAPQGLYPILPDYMRVERRWATDRRTLAEQELVESSLLYTVQTSSGSVELSPYRVCHIPSFGHNGIVGQSVVSVARNNLSLGLQYEKHGERFFSQGSSNPFVITCPERTQPKQYNESKAALKEQYQGSQGHLKGLVLPPGFAVTTIGISPEDAQFLESRRFAVADVARWFQLPLHRLAEAIQGGSLTYSNVESENLAFLQSSLQPWLTLIESEFNRYFFGDDDSYYFEFLVDSLLRTDARTRNEIYKIATGGKAWMMPSEVRERENLPAVEGIDEQPAPAPAPAQSSTQDEDIARTWRPLLQECLQRAVALDVNALRKFVERMEKGINKEPFDTFLDDHYRKVAGKLRDILSGTLAAYAREAGRRINVEEMITRYVDETKSALNYTADFNLKRIRGLLETWYGSRALDMTTALMGGNGDGR